MDVKTIDELNVFSFKDDAAKKRWVKLVETRYFEYSEDRVIMDFTRRWGKVMEYEMKRLQKPLKDVVVSSARLSDLSNSINSRQLREAIKLLLENWVFSKELGEWISAGGKVTLR